MAGFESHVIELCSLIFAILAFLIAVFSLIEVKAMQRSTHEIKVLNPLATEFENLSGGKMPESESYSSFERPRKDKG